MRRERYRVVLAIILLFTLVITAGCSEETESSPAATRTPLPTHTPVPTNTPEPPPTDTPAPPTSTPSGAPPTSAPKPTATSASGSSEAQPEPASTSAPQPPQPPQSQGNVGSQLRTTMVNKRVELEHFGGMIDVALGAGRVSCQEVVDRYDALAASPTYDVSGSPDNVKGAHDQYRRAIGIFTQGAKDMAQNCRDYLANPKPGSIPFQQWGVARQSVNDAIGVMNAGLQMLQ